MFVEEDGYSWSEREEERGRGCVFPQWSNIFQQVITTQTKQAELRSGTGHYGGWGAEGEGRQTRTQNKEELLG